MVARDLRELVAQRAAASPDDPPLRAHAVGLGDGGRVCERRTQAFRLGLEVRVERQLLRHEERRDEDDARAAVGREPAGEVERMLRLAAAEERDHDAPVADRGSPPGEAAGPAAESADVRALHRIWYGTLARITPGSTSRSRLT
jgi:hypothetical protein